MVYKSKILDDFFNVDKKSYLKTEQKMTKIKKLLDLSDNCVKTLSKRAIDENTNFKLYAQAILEREATSNNFEKTAVRGTKKNKNK
jgi:hypothetical protein